MATKLRIGEEEFYPGIGKIEFEGKDSKDPLAFKYYDAEKVVAGKKMGDYFKFEVAYRHSSGESGADSFGPSERDLPWRETRRSDRVCEGENGRSVRVYHQARRSVLLLPRFLLLYSMQGMNLMAMLGDKISSRKEFFYQRYFSGAIEFRRKKESSSRGTFT